MSTSQTIKDIAVICSQHGVNQLILSPGSRNAPLALAFARHPEITTRIIPDERSAAYIAIGIAQSQKRAVLLVCTSGTAAINFGPAIAEAFYQHIPLLVITADRPPEWIDQNDGQSIRQTNLFQNHTIRNYQLPVDDEHTDAKWHVNRTINEAVLAAKDGPVHINAPFREPFYPAANEVWQYGEHIRVIQRSETTTTLSPGEWDLVINEWAKSKKVLVVGGQGPYSESLSTALEKLIQHASIPLIGDIVSNLHRVNGVIQRPEIILGLHEDAIGDLKPDLLISFNRAIVSKNLKKFLRKYKPVQHWHLQEEGLPPDTFQGLTRVLQVKPAKFFIELRKKVAAQNDSSWFESWKQLSNRCIEVMKPFTEENYLNELSATSEILKYIGTCHLHLANSTPVRLVDLLGISKDIVEVSGNRGTSGIDGCTSTAVGHTLINQRTNVLITGDMAFFYDRNALWHPYKLPNLKIIILNNHGGGIFKLIDGPRQQPELQELFVTEQRLNAENTANDFGMKYIYCDQLSELPGKLNALMTANDQASILEIEFSQDWSAIYQELKKELNRIK